jgi:hypothetical protein
LKKLPFAHFLLAVLAISFIIGFAVFVLSGATTDKGTPSAIRAERTIISRAEKTRCKKYGAYTSIPTLRREGLLTFKPLYNSVVVVPGNHCGTIIIGSSSYQSTAN